MASVSSLDKDLRKMRLEKYTPAAANEARSWIEDILGESLSSSDLLEGLKDGVALCKLANLAIPPPGLRFKKSAMPFVQMENISLFLRACQSPPLNLQQHDTFLTVDLFEQKDPAQVLQCIGAFSRAAHAANPQKFPMAIGPKNRPETVTPQGTGSRTPTGTRDRGASVASNKSPAFGRSAMMPHRTGDSGSGRWSPTKSPRNRPESPSAVSSWSKKEHEGTTSPAWNIAQYGYLGGASQGNLGISFGGRRQITNASPRVPTLADKERRRKEEEERARLEAEESERRRAEEEERAKMEEELRWEEETEQLRQKEREAAEEEKRRWEEEERQWKLTEEQRRREEEEAEARLIAERKAIKTRNDSKLTGQFLSQYRAEQAAPQQDGASEDDYKNRVKQLEQELELARQREAEYERERQERAQRQGSAEARPTPKPKPKLISSPPTRSDSWSRDEREVLRTRSPFNREPVQANTPPALPSRSPRPLPDPTALPQAKSPNTSSRPLPDPAAYASKPSPASATRTDRFLSSNPAPSPPAAQATYSRELGATAEQDAEDQRRTQSQSKTKAGGWASKSLLEREMEMERQRQREWEDAQKETAAAVRSSEGVEGIGGGIGGRWDVGQWAGYTGGDSQNKGSIGIGAGRRQI
ncbi:calponin [Fusarium chlamydosporum]